MSRAPAILVAAGTNGAGKSSIVQPFVERAGGRYFNPDSLARELMGGGMPKEEADIKAWETGHGRLVGAVEAGAGFAFETTLGGHSMPFQLMRALAFQRNVIILYVGLDSVDLHLQRVKARVARGGHDIPEDKVRQRYDDSRRNLLQFIGTAATVRVWDNSAESGDGRPATAVEVFATSGRRLVLPQGADPRKTPAWARPLLAQAIKLGLKQESVSS